MANIDFTDNSDEIKNEFEKAIERALVKVGMTAEAYAKLELSTPKEHKTGKIHPNVDTGRLRGSITFATSGSHDKGESPAEAGDYELRGNPERGTVYIGTNVEYAPYVEMGTSRAPAYPYIRPAVENHIDEYKNLIESELRGK